MSNSKSAYDAARREILLTTVSAPALKLSGQTFTFLDRLPPEIEKLNYLNMLDLSGTQIVDFTPLAGLTGLESLRLESTVITDLTPLAGLSRLKHLDLDNTPISELAPLAKLHRLQHLDLGGTHITNLMPLSELKDLRNLWLENTQIRDLRPIVRLEQLGANGSPGLCFNNTLATKYDSSLAELAQIKSATERARATLAYLRDQPLWPAPLPWEVSASQEGAPPLDPSLPLEESSEGISLAAKPIGGSALGDPLRPALYDELRYRVTVLCRVSGNIDDTVYRESCRLRDLLEAELPDMDALRVHLTIEVLRRYSSMRGRIEDSDLTSALGAVVEIGPGLTVDTEPVDLLISRQNKNRNIIKETSVIEAEIRIADLIASSNLSSPILKVIARLSAAPNIEDQLSGIRPILTRNYLIFVGSNALLWASQGIVGNAGYEAVRWLAMNASDIATIARYCGEPFAAWMLPILARSKEMIDGAQYAGAVLMERRSEPYR